MDHVNRLLGVDPHHPAIVSLDVFIVGRDGNFDIFWTDGDTTVNLTNDPGTDARPRWSADGAHIVFRTNRDGNFEIYFMNADGSNQTRVTNHPAIDAISDWSPDGTQLGVPHQQRRGPVGDLHDRRRRLEPDPPHQQHRVRDIAGMVAGRREDCLSE